MEEKSVKLDDIDVARIGLGTNRLTKTRDNVAFVRSAVAAGVQMIDPPTPTQADKVKRRSARLSRRSPRLASWQPKAGSVALGTAAQRCCAPS
jgi:hypothetical protein